MLASRRGFLAGLAALIAAPALVRAENIMPISAAKLWTPPTTLIGAIRPHVGVIPDGWLPCDGRWVVKRDYQALYAILGDKYGANGSSAGSFFLPDMTAQAELDRKNGKEVGRYVVYGGDERIAAKEKLDLTVAGISARPVRGAVADKWYSMDWREKS